MAKGLFHVSMIVSADALHAVTTAAALHKASNVQIEPVLESKKKNDTSEPSAPRIPVKTLLIPWWAKTKTFNMKEVMIAFADHLTKGAIYTATLKAMNDGWLQRTGPGEYKTTAKINKAVKALTSANGGSTHGNAATQRTAPPRKVNEVTHRDFVLQNISKGNVTYKSILAAFDADGRKRVSINGAIGKLKEDKQIANSGPGEYKLLAKGSEHLKSL